jgi:hypothetical protein
MKDKISDEALFRNNILKLVEKLEIRFKELNALLTTIKINAH